MQPSCDQIQLARNTPFSRHPVSGFWLPGRQNIPLFQSKQRTWTLFLETRGYTALQKQPKDALVRLGQRKAIGTAPLLESKNQRYTPVNSVGLPSKLRILLWSSVSLKSLEGERLSDDHLLVFSRFLFFSFFFFPFSALFPCSIWR